MIEPSFVGHRGIDVGDQRHAGLGGGDGHRVAVGVVADEDDVGPVGPQDRPVVLEHAAVAGEPRANQARLLR